MIYRTGANAYCVQALGWGVDFITLGTASGDIATGGYRGQNHFPQIRESARVFIPPDETEAWDWRLFLPEVSGGTAHSLAGVADGTSSATGALKLGAVLAAIANGVGTATGTLDVTTGGTSHSLAGTTDGTSSATGALKLGAVLAGTMNGTSTATGALKLGAVLRGESAGTSTVTGNMTAEWILAGTANGTSSATGNLLVVELGASDLSESANFQPILYLLRKR